MIPQTGADRKLIGERKGYQELGDATNWRVEEGFATHDMSCRIGKTFIPSAVHIAFGIIVDRGGGGGGVFIRDRSEKRGASIGIGKQ